MASPDLRLGLNLKNGRSVSPTPAQLRSLVMEHLCHHCYTNTARAFARDSSVRHLDADGDEIQPRPRDSPELSDAFLSHVDLREKIRVHIQCGRVEEAMEVLNEHFPSVLNGPLPKRPSLASPEDKDRLTQMEYVASTSVDPVHLTLNLRILAFIEACRTIPLEPPTSSVNSDPSTSHKTPTTKRNPAPSTGSLEHQLNLLSKAQKLHTLAKTLPNATDRAIYTKELNNIGGLLAYKVPETSSIAKYLSQERRDAVADQINSAILDRSAMPSVSSLELVTRYTATLWSFAHELGVAPRPGAVLPPIIEPTEPTEPTQKVSESDSDQAVVPPFDLEQFLDVKT